MKVTTGFRFKIFEKKDRPVIFFFTGFGNRYWFHYSAIRKLTRAGYCVVVYDIHKNTIMQGSAEDFVNLVNKVVETVKTQVDNSKKLGTKDFFVFGVSMGTIFALRAAIEIPEIKKIVANLTYGSFADNMWTWKKVDKIKKRFQEEGLNKEQLEKILRPVSPLSMAPKLKGKKLLLYLAKKDKVILFSQSKRFKQALDQYGIDYTYHQNEKFGHLISALINNSRSKVYLDFLKND